MNYTYEVFQFKRDFLSHESPPNELHYHVDTRQQHQHGCKRAVETVLFKKDENQNKSGYIDKCAYVKGRFVSYVSC